MTKRLCLSFIGAGQAFALCTLKECLGGHKHTHTQRRVIYASKRDVSEHDKVPYQLTWDGTNQEGAGRAALYLNTHFFRPLGFIFGILFASTRARCSCMANWTIWLHSLPVTDWLIRTHSLECLTFPPPPHHPPVSQEPLIATRRKEFFFFFSISACDREHLTLKRCLSINTHTLTDTHTCCLVTGLGQRLSHRCWHDAPRGSHMRVSLKLKVFVAIALTSC